MCPGAGAAANGGARAYSHLSYAVTSFGFETCSEVVFERLSKEDERLGSLFVFRPMM